MSTTDLMNMPAMKPPPGVIPDFDSPPNENTMAVAVMSAGIVTTCLFLGLLIPIKTAILVEWIRIFLPNGGNRRNLFFWACHFMIWANIVFCIVMLILVNLSCVPYEYLWNRTLKGGYCRINTAYTSLSAACFAFSTDIIILFIPQRVIWKLNMSRNRKLGVSVVFALGMAACAASIVRLYYTVGRAASNDLTYHLSSVQLTAVGEGACVILVLCVPSVPKALSGFKIPDLLSSIPSWGSLVSFVRQRPSQESLRKNNAGVVASSWPRTSGENDAKKWQTGSSSERYLVPLEQIPNIKDQDPEFGNIIFRSTEFEANTSYDSSQAVILEQRSRQHPWMQK
ncbi:hypothetical protein SLS64_007466 [Diaporthe eres]|uniref:Rhodopsin domain-containing protein n=1 Tax=Diaporthe eres TaxID=83184 RepID=A0ABR1NMS2_DIAER